MTGEYDAGYEHYIDELHSEIIDYQIEVEQVKAENAKLRELVRYAYECAVHSSHETCDECRRMNGYCILEHRMRELVVDA